MHQEEEEYYDNELEPEIKIFRLISGDDIISCCVECTPDEDDSHHFVLNDPMIIQHYRKNGRSLINIQPWMPRMLVEYPEYKLYTGDILFVVNPSEMMVKSYFEAVEKNSVPKSTEKKETTQEILDTYDRLEPSIEGNKNVAKFVSNELKKIRKASSKK